VAEVAKTPNILCFRNRAVATNKLQPMYMTSGKILGTCNSECGIALWRSKLWNAVQGSKD
jgi:hypothetical protein